MLEIYKRGQGKYTRVLTIVGVMLVTLIGALVLSDSLSAWVNTSNQKVNKAIAFGIPSLVVLGMAAFIFWLINRPQTADFLIATESEMKKVSWSSRKEIVGSTKVVIITTLMVAFLLYGVDSLFVFLFDKLNIMGLRAQ